MPVLHTGRKPNHIARLSSFDRAAPLLHKSTAGGHDESLSQRMSMPFCARARFKGYARPRERGRGASASKSGSTRTGPVKFSAGAGFEGCEPFRVIFMVDCGSVLVCPWPSAGMANVVAAMPVNLMKSRLAMGGWDDGFMILERFWFQIECGQTSLNFVSATLPARRLPILGRHGRMSSHPHAEQESDAGEFDVTFQQIVRSAVPDYRSRMADPDRCYGRPAHYASS